MANVEILDDMLFESTISQDFDVESSEGESEEDLLLSSFDVDQHSWGFQSSLIDSEREPIRQIGRHPELKHQQTEHKTNETSSINAEATERNISWVIVRVEHMLERIVDGILNEDQSLSISLKSRGNTSKRRNKGVSDNEPRQQAKSRDITFPGATAQEAWNFAVLLRILELIHGQLIENTVMTKRDLYYRHPSLFLKQSVVDRYVDDLAYTLGVTRSQLHITAAAKGLVAGNFSILRHDGQQMYGMCDLKGILVPVMNNDDTLDVASIQWILVIEKEATFQSLLSSTIWEVLASQGLVLTAKGYPDLSSLNFLRQVAGCAPHLPVYAMVDLDPDGLAILSTYKYGSDRLAHEFSDSSGTTPSQLLNISWLGLKSQHLGSPETSAGDPDSAASPHLRGLMRLTARDRNKAIRMLEWDLCADDGKELHWRRELQRMLVLNVKAELQILDELPGGMAAWLLAELEAKGERIDGSGGDEAGHAENMLF